MERGRDEIPLVEYPLLLLVWSAGIADNAMNMFIALLSVPRFAFITIASEGLNPE
jgi:hypothetical protein